MYANVLIQYSAKSLDRTFTYHIPNELVNDLSNGMKVNVEFGNQIVNGFVIGITNIKPDYETKDIKSVVTKDLKLNEELLELGNYIKEKTLCSLISAYQTMLPTSMKVNNSKESYDLIKTYISLNENIDIEDYISKNQTRTKQIEILHKLIDGKVLKSEINGSSLKTLLNKNIVKEEHINVFRINPDIAVIQKPELTLLQKDAYNKIAAGFNTSKTYLLHGVTGSGKTEIYMELIENVIKENKTAIMLVPEITLTTQIVKRFYNRFGDDVAIFHSSLSDGEKYDEYKKIMNGLVHVVVGTRSAIFTPVNNLGIIIIDEEHSSTYKQENNPRYHALDIAKWRSNYNHCPLVLGSATPSLESMARAKKGVYEFISISERVGDAKLPSIRIIDMAPEYKKRNMILSDELQHLIMERLERHEQVMLLLNRRGFSTITTCQSCGYTYKCPYCDITLTYHKTSNHLRCHYCGYTLVMNEICPECHEKAIRDYGLGTEKVEQLIRELYPSYKVVRMDADTTARKGSNENIIKGIENHEYDIIIGTQMISKGLDFPNVTLVGVINADESLNIPDFRSGENTFSLLSQVSGRAGRSNLPGEVIIQTFNPDNKTLNYVKNNNYLGNYEYEMNIRHKLKYPPYYYLIGIKVTSKDYNLVSKEANKIANYIRENISDSSICLGPTTASQFRINNIYRFQLIIKYKKDDKLNSVLKYIDEEYIYNKNINIEIDVDPIRI